jgi:prolyl-tRNA synthetase
MGIGPQQMIKTLVFTATTDQGKKFNVIACVRGDHEVNEAKLGKLVPNLALADDAEARAAGFAIGYVGPHIVNTVAAKLIIDPAALAVADAVTGSNKADHHIKGFNWKTALTSEKATRATVADIRNATPEDRAPNGAELIFSKGIELGHVFKLGTKYTDALGCTYLDEKQKNHSMIMGCYGIGAGRVLVGVLETKSDADGIIWPMAIAPYHVVITPIKYDGQAKAVADQLHADLTKLGVDVLVDDRDQRPGVKFKDADLIGIPLRIVLGDKSLANNEVELKLRTEKEPRMLPLAGLAEAIAGMVKGAIG